MNILTPKIYACLTILVLCGCATDNEPRPDLYEILSLGKMPEGNELKNECTCLKEEMDKVNAFADQLSHSRYAVYYHALSREKIAELQNRADDIACKYPLVLTADD